MYMWVPFAFDSHAHCVEETKAEARAMCILNVLSFHFQSQHPNCTPMILKNLDFIQRVEGGGLVAWGE